MLHQNKNPKSVLFARHAAELVSNHDDEQAFALLEEGTILHPAYATGFLLLGKLLSRRGELSKSQESFERALALDPQNPRLMFMLGRQYLETDPDRARELLWKARRYEPDEKTLAEVFHDALSEIEITEPISEPPQETTAGISAVHDESLPAPEATGTIPETGIDGVGEDSLRSQGASDAGIFEGSETAHLDNAIDELLSGVPVSEEEADDTRPKYISSIPFRDEAGFEDTAPGREVGTGSLDSAEDIPPLEEMTDTGFSLHVFEPAKPEPETARESEPSETGREPESAPEEEPLQPERDLIENEPETETAGVTDAGDFTGAYTDVLEHSFSGMSSEDIERNTVEIPEEEFTDLRFDENTTEIIADSILTDQERAELTGLDSVSSLEQRETEKQIPGHADAGGILFESAGELSQEELDSLSSVMKTEHEGQTEPDLHDGIDYSDARSGQTVETDGGASLEELETLKTLDEFEDFVRKVHRGEGSIEERPAQGEEPACMSEPTVPEISGPDIGGTAEQAGDAFPEIISGEISPAGMETAQEFPAPPETVPVSADVVDTDTLEDDEAVEDLIRGSMAPEEVASMEAASLDALIDDYVKVLGLQGESPTPAASLPEINRNETPPVQEPVSPPREEIPETGDIESFDFPIERGEATATMAEIFFKQGMISRAIAIYRSLVKKQPQNEKLLTRLKELQRLHETKSGST